MGELVLLEVARNGAPERVKAPSKLDDCSFAAALDESSTLGIVLKVAGKLLLRLNTESEIDSEEVV